ncbi:Urease accessory protein D [Spatholobus suberectus]|nr:Urease accessory protein D [Spatholobus suberectus]
MRSGEGDKEMEMGSVVVDKVGGRSSLISCFSRYPLKFIIPKKVGSSNTDAVWVYALNYGGGIVSGDHISCKFSVGDACTMGLTTQGSTKFCGPIGPAIMSVTGWIGQSGSVFKTLDYVIREGKNRMSTRTHAQLPSNCNDCTLGMQYIQNLVQDHMKKIMSEKLQHPSAALSHQRDKADHFITKPSFIASCSAFGPKRIGLLVRVAAETTESVFKFLRHQLAPLEPMMGVPPYK